MAFSLDTKKVLDALGYIPAKESSGKYFYHCPLHKEMHGASFCVFPDGGWNCFGKCGTGGDAIHFLALHDQVPYSAAIKKAEAIFGIRINRDDRKEKYAHLYTVNRKYADLFHDELVSGKHPDLMKYLLERGINREAVDRWKVGYFHKDLVMQNADEYELLAEAGLLLKKDRFMSALGFEKDGRVVFPVSDFDGDIVAFSARINPFAPTEIKKEYSKYINTGTTPIFEKKFSTFGYARALYDLIRDFGGVVIVEGAVDALILQEQLIPGVALMGLGANNPDSTEFLTKFTKHIIFFLDGDKAGFDRIIKIAKGSLFEVINRNPKIEIGVAFPPLGKDPDEYVLENRSACYETLQNAEALEEYVFKQIVERVKSQPTFPKKRACLFEEFGEVLRAYPRSVRKHYLQEIEKQTELEAYEELLKDIPVVPAASNSRQTNHFDSQAEQQPTQGNTYHGGRKPYSRQAPHDAASTPPEQESESTVPCAAPRRVTVQWRNYPHLMIIKANPDLLEKANAALKECGFKELTTTHKVVAEENSEKVKLKKIGWASVRSSFVSEYLKLITDLGSKLDGGLASPDKMSRLREIVMQKDNLPAVPEIKPTL